MAKNETVTPLRVDLYIRVSGQEQAIKGLSLEAQQITSCIPAILEKPAPSRTTPAIMLKIPSPNTPINGIEIKMIAIPAKTSITPMGIFDFEGLISVGDGGATGEVSTEKR